MLNEVMAYPDCTMIKWRRSITEITFYVEQIWLYHWVCLVMFRVCTNGRALL